MTALGDAVNTAREQQGWSRNQLSALSWIDIRAISRICKGEVFTPHRLTLRRLDWVFGWDDGYAESLVPAYRRTAEKRAS